MQDKYPIKCQGCGNINYYKSKYKKTKSCLNCRFKVHGHPFSGRHHSDETKQKLSDINSGKTWEEVHGIDGALRMREQRKLRRGITPYVMSDEIKKKMSDAKLGEKSAWFGKKHSPETKEKISKANSGKNCFWYGKTFTEEHKEKLRLARINQVRTKYGGVYYNTRACDYFKALEKENGWNGYYASKNDEFIIAGYSVDYYEPNENIIIEYDEPHHYTPRGKLKKRDILRQEIIMKRSDAKFYRYNEITGELNEYRRNTV
jgi:hypothetical protein